MLKDLKGVKVAITGVYLGEHPCYNPLKDAGVESHPFGFDRPYTEALKDYDCIFAGVW